MRRKMSSSGNGGYNNQRQKQRYQQGGGGSQGGHGGHNGRPRKNYPALRENYLAKARDALASGDRVLAENYFQHADHCYRMMMEEGQHRQHYTPPPQHAGGESNGHSHDSAAPNGHAEESDGGAQLPAFLTASFDPAEQAKAEPVIVQNWEE